MALVLFQHLENRVVLAVDRKQPAAARPDRCDEEIAGRYQAFLVGKGDIGAAAGGRKGRRQARGADDCRHHPVGFAVGGFHQAGLSRSDRDAAAGKFALQRFVMAVVCRDRQPRAGGFRLPGQQFDIAVACQHGDFEALPSAQVIDDIECILADRTRRTEDAEAPRRAFAGYHVVFRENFSRRLRLY